MVLLPPGMLLTDQLTPAFEVPVTVAANVCVPPSEIDADGGFTTTVTSGSMVIIEVASVTPPPGGRDMGECLVSGRVNRVERGPRQVGKHLALSVSCAGPHAQIPSGGTLWQDLERLKHSRFGRAFLGADGGVIAYDML